MSQQYKNMGEVVYFCPVCGHIYDELDAISYDFACLDCGEELIEDWQEVKDDGE